MTAPRVLTGLLPLFVASLVAGLAWRRGREADRLKAEIAALEEARSESASYHYGVLWATAREARRLTIAAAQRVSVN